LLIYIHAMRSKETIILAIVVLLLFVGGCSGCRVRNALVTAEEAVKSEWANVESAYQRRADLIPNLVRTVERAESFDRGLIESMQGVQQRSGALRLTEAELLDASRLAEYGAAQDEVGSSLHRLLDVSQASEELRSVEAFRDLQDQIEGSENRINFARRDYNEAVEQYNSRVRRFPTNIVAAVTGFDPRPAFEADAGAEDPPRVE
jgi:LemA protein